MEISLIKANKQQNNDCNFFVEGEIEAILEKRERVQYEDAFSKYERGALVLVEGRPGSGKTTLAHKITKDWANGMVLQNVHMVFLISLRKDKKKSGIFKTFFQSRSKVSQTKLEKSSGDRVCFILSDNGIILDGAAPLIAGGLQFLTFLQELNLSITSIDSSSVIALAEGIQFCPLLHTLAITKNTIGSSGVIALAGGLQCKKMECVNLSHIEALATLVQLSQLQKLDLSQNKIGSTGALCLITELISNVHSTTLNLLINNISPKAIKFLSTLLCRNPNLRVLLNSNSQPLQPP